MSNTYDIGDRRRLSCEIRDETGQLGDPTTVSFRMYEPDKTVTEYVYGVDDEIYKDSTGHYHVEWDITQAGIHWWRFAGAGSIGVAEETKFTVRKSKVPLDQGS